MERMIRQRFRILQFFAFVTSAMLVATGLRAQEGTLGCKSIVLEEPPSWVTSGAWGSSGELLLVDLFRARLQPYSQAGKRLEPIVKLNGLDEADFMPSRIAKSKDGYLLENREGEMIWLDKDLAVVRRLNLVGQTNAKHLKIRSIEGWAESPGRLFVLANLQQGGNYSSAYIEVPTDSPESFTRIQSMSSTSQERKLYRMAGRQYFASTEDHTFLWRWDGEPGLIRKGLAQPAGGGNIQLATRTSKAQRSVPVLQSFPFERLFPDESPGTTMGFSRIGFIRRDGVENREEKSRTKIRRLSQGAEVKSPQKVPDGPPPPLNGLFGRGDSLYALTQFADRGVGSWQLKKIDDIEKPNEWPARVIPSDAAHLLVLPGDEYWGFLEIEELTRAGQMEIARVLLLPTPWIEDGRLPLDGGVGCRIE